MFDLGKLTGEVLKLPQIQSETNHYHAHGIYARTVFSAAGTLIIGKVHKTEHLYCVLSGKVRVVTKEGTFDLDATKAPQILTCPVGTQRAVYILEDAWRMNVHLNLENIIDLDILENELVDTPEDCAFLPGNILKKEYLPCPSL